MMSQNIGDQSVAVKSPPPSGEITRERDHPVEWRVAGV
jgi:hypothetical protein